MKVIIVGGGPAGMMAAITASKEGNEVTLIEKNNILGKKLLITGKGRCNITSSLDMDEFINNIPGNGKFLYSAFKNFSNIDIINFLSSHGLKVKEERGHRYFPVTDNAKDVLDCFTNELKNRQVKIKFNTSIKEIIIQDQRAIGIVVINSNGDISTIYGDKIIIATGGKSFPGTGSTGDGYDILTRCGHTIVAPHPSIVPLEAEKRRTTKMQGLSLRNVKIQIKDIESNHIIYEDFGEMIFTHFGVGGPTILSASAHLLRYKNIEDKISRGKIQLVIDLKPALSEEKLDERILRDFEEFKNKEFKNSLDKLLPKKAIDVVIEDSKIPFDKKVNSITKAERQQLLKVLKNFTFRIDGFRPIEEAIVTSGGVSIKEINPKTMESKIIPGLFFAGEIIDVDAYTGGFNLQIAYSTGYTAGLN